MHGAGIYTFSEGSIIEGKWVRGRLDGKVVFTKVKDNIRKIYHSVCKDNLLAFDVPGLPQELNSPADIQSWHY